MSYVEPAIANVIDADVVDSLYAIDYYLTLNVTVVDGVSPSFRLRNIGVVGIHTAEVSILVPNCRMDSFIKSIFHT